MKAHNYEIGTVLSFSYDKNGVERPGHGVLLRVHQMASGWLIVMDDMARGRERSFWEHKMSDVRACSFPHSCKDRNEAECYAAGYARAMGPNFSAVTYRTDLGWEVMAVQKAA